MHLALIPARSGSKGIKDKNIKSLAGVPLMAHTIRSAKESGIFDIVMVSTESAQYADIARDFGAQIPFLRDEKLSQDNISKELVALEAVKYYNTKGKKISAITILQPTSPLRNANDIRQAHKIFVHKKAKAVVSVCETEHSPLWCNILPDDNSLDGFITEDIQFMPRQQLPVFYRLNGAIFMINLNMINLETSNLYQNGCYAYVMPKLRSVDIDDELDFITAEAVLKFTSKDSVKM